MSCLFPSPHVCCTFMKHLFSKSTDLAFGALLLSSGKYRLLISGCLYLSQHHLLEDSRTILVLIFWLSQSMNKAVSVLVFPLHLYVSILRRRNREVWGGGTVIFRFFGRKTNLVGRAIKVVFGTNTFFMGVVVQNC